MKRVFERLIDERQSALKLKTTQIASNNQSIDQSNRGCPPTRLYQVVENKEDRTDGHHRKDFFHE